MIFAEPRFAPVMVGCAAGVDCPARIVTLAGEIVTLAVSLLESVTVTLTGAGWGKLTASEPVCPKPRLAVAGTLMAPALWTVTLVVALATFGTAVLAVIVVKPS